MSRPPNARIAKRNWEIQMNMARKAAIYARIKPPQTPDDHSRCTACKAGIRYDHNPINPPQTDKAGAR